MLNQYRCALQAAIFLIMAGSAAADPTTTTLLGDRWNYPFNGTLGTRSSASLFNSNIPTFGFNKRDAEVVAQWQTALPDTVQGTSYTVTSARIEVWSLPNAPWDPAVTRLELYAAGFGPEYRERSMDPTTGTVWVETSPFVGGGPAVSSHRARDPFPRDFVTDNHAEDDLAATPWAMGTHPDYASTGQTSGTFKVTFDLPVGNGRVQQELQEDLAKGVSSWVISTNYVSTGQNDAAYPSIYLRGTAAPPAPAGVPVMVIEVEPHAGVADWVVY
jgi:hypothetical protein